RDQIEKLMKSFNDDLNSIVNEKMKNMEARDKGVTVLAEMLQKEKEDREAAEKLERERLKAIKRDAIERKALDSSVSLAANLISLGGNPELGRNLQSLHSIQSRMRDSITQWNENKPLYSKGMSSFSNDFQLSTDMIQLG